MRITEIREATVSIPSPYRTASIHFDAMTASVVAIHTDARRDGRKIIGLAFDSVGRYGHGGLLRERFIPRLLAADPATYADDAGGIDPERAWTVMMRNEKPGGHGERAGAVGLLDAALWDIVAKHEGRPLWRTLADRYNGGRGDGWVALYASGGHYRDTDDLPHLRAEISRARDAGHDHFKIKIGAIPLGQDLRRVEAALAAIGNGRLAVDGNGCFDRETAFAYASALSEYDLAWLEEPVDPLDFQLHAELARAWPIPLATGENLFSAADARNLLRYGGLRRDRDLLQFDISLSYGVVEYMRIVRLFEERGWNRSQCVPHAGHLLALHAVAGLGLGRFETASDPESPFGEVPAGTTIEDGRAHLADVPGAGFEATPRLMTLFGTLID